MSLLWNELLYQPLYNFLIFLTSIMPGYDLGLAIILLTLIIRSLLYLPSRNSLKSQTAMQELQPKLQELKERYKNDQQRHAQETMKLYKESGVNPFSSCLPLLIQFPVLIALFYVFRGVLTPDNHQYTYEFLRSFDQSKINVMFLGHINLIELTPFSRYVMPLIVGSLQYIQMSMLTKKQAATCKIKTTSNQPFDPAATNKMMTYFMPVMVAFFAASFPVGLSMYWATSTLFGITQQKIMFSKKSELSKEQEKDIIEVKPLAKVRKKSKKAKNN